jgi:hypothetical protein
MAVTMHSLLALLQVLVWMSVRVPVQILERMMPMGAKQQQHNYHQHRSQQPTQ